jgi:hypothetical protein
MDKVDAIAASGLVSASILAALVQMLAARGVLSDADTREIYQAALDLIAVQERSMPDARQVCAAAREVIEAHLRAREP